MEVAVPTVYKKLWYVPATYVVRAYQAVGLLRHSIFCARNRRQMQLAVVTAMIGVLGPALGHAEEIILHVPVITDSPDQNLYFHELLTTAVEESGHTIRIVPIELPQSRAVLYLDTGEISIYWRVESDEKNQKYLPIEVGLTRGLIGQRILLIRRGNQHLFDKVSTLEDFRNLNLVGAMGENWFDVKVWQANNLKYNEQRGNWQAIFKMLDFKRGFDYFPRGMNEILIEAEKYPNLEIEKNLVLIYDRDFRFYLSKTGPNAGAKNKEILEKAMQKARVTGLIDRLVKKYWGDDFRKLNFDKRTKILLSTPR